MTEPCPSPARRLPDYVEDLECVILPEIPTVYALHHPEDGVTAWVFALPGGLTIIVFLDDDGEAEGAGLVYTTLESAATRWATLDDAELVLVTT
ncbi:MAG TPA: hypothetical protein VFQ77_02145 [Pseudonocardiaceae bacterium]|jgi:hypothetical protein|nr:hypothetical protein [Pseudonocardiaceae bacterium]